jgi:hypothetical protein
LNDINFSFTSKNQLVRWINEGRRNLAKNTGCVRRWISGQSAFGAQAQPNYAIPGAMTPSSIPDALPYGQGATTGGAFSDAFGSAFNTGSAGSSIGAVATLTMQTIPGVERYPYRGFFNAPLQAQHAGVDSIQDVITCAVNWGGVDRPALDWMPWDDFQAYCRAYAVLNTSYPSVWSTLNDGAQGELWLFPIPSQAGDIELDCFCLPKRIYSNDDFEAIPDGFTEMVKFATAELVYLSSKRYADAEQMRNQYMTRTMTAVVSRDRGKTKSYYYQVP